MRKILMALVLVLIAITPSLAMEMIGKWGVDISKSALDGTQTVILVTRPEGGEKGALGIRCMEKTDIFIDIESYMGGDSQTMRYRVDDGPIKQIIVNPTTDGRALVISGRAEEFVKKELLGHKKLVLSVTGYRKRATERIFDLTDLDDAVAPHRKICKVE